MTQQLDPYDGMRQKFWEATNSLVGDGSIQDRLAGAATFLTLLAPDEVKRLPKDVRVTFDAVTQALTKHPAEIPGESTIAASAQKLTGEEGARLAREIFGMYVDLHGGI